MFFKSFNKSFW